MDIKTRIEERKKIRAEIADHITNCQESTFLLISQAIDDYLEHRVETDKVIVGILKDIQGNLASITEIHF